MTGCNVMPKLCTGCGSVLVANGTVCGHCGLPICSGCGSTLTAHDQFCGHCGKSVPVAPLDWWEKFKADNARLSKEREDAQNERIKNGTGNWWDKIVGMAQENVAAEKAGRKAPYSVFDEWTPAMERAGLSGIWEDFRRAYDTAYDDAKRANQNSHQSQDYRQSEPVKPQRSPYHVLGVRENAPWSEVKSAYRKAMMNLHPDRVAYTGMNPKMAGMRTQEVNAAYVELEFQRGVS